MKREIAYRKYKGSDRKELVRVIEKVYGINRFFEHEKDILCCAEICLLNGLIQSDFVRVMTINGKPQGVIAGYFGKAKSKGIFYKLKRLIQWGKLKLPKRNRECMCNLKKIWQIDGELFSTGNGNGGTVSLFAVNPNCCAEEKNGLLGLWKKSIKILEKRGSRILLENHSDIGYFEKNGFQKKVQREIMIQPAGQRFRFYRYLYVEGLDT